MTCLAGPVTGASGQLAAFIVRAFADREVIPLTRAALDVTDPAAVATAVAGAAPDLIVNCAAFNDVDGAEDRPTEALALNALAVRSLAPAAETARRRARALQLGLRHQRLGNRAIRGGRAALHRAASTPHQSSSVSGSHCEAPRAFVLRVESLFGISGGLERPPRDARSHRRRHRAGP